MSQDSLRAIRERLPSFPEFVQFGSQQSAQSNASPSQVNTIGLTIARLESNGTVLITKDARGIEKQWLLIGVPQCPSSVTSVSKGQRIQEIRSSDDSVRLFTLEASGCKKQWILKQDVGNLRLIESHFLSLISKG